MRCIFLHTEDPDRPCHVACQDEEVNHRFYLVNGEDGWFPFGTDCSRGVHEKRAYCISGKCLVSIPIIIETHHDIDNYHSHMCNHCFHIMACLN
jgi:hypothetical protein